MRAKIGFGMLACGTIMASAALPARAQTDPSAARPAYVVYDTGTLGGDPTSRTTWKVLSP